MFKIFILPFPNYPIDLCYYWICAVLKGELYDILATHSGKTVKQIEKDSDRDYWMKAPQAKEYGLIDEVLERKK